MTLIQKLRNFAYVTKRLAQLWLECPVEYSEQADCAIMPLPEMQTCDRWRTFVELAVDIRKQWRAKQCRNTIWAHQHKMPRELQFLAAWMENIEGDLKHFQTQQTNMDEAPQRHCLSGPRISQDAGHRKTIHRVIRIANTLLQRHTARLP